MKGERNPCILIPSHEADCRFAVCLASTVDILSFTNVNMVYLQHIITCRLVSLAMLGGTCPCSGLLFSTRAVRSLSAARLSVSLPASWKSGRRTAMTFLFASHSTPWEDRNASTRRGEGDGGGEASSEWMGSKEWDREREGTRGQVVKACIAQ